MDEMTPGQRATAAARGKRRRTYEERIARVLQLRGWKVESPYDQPPKPLDPPNQTNDPNHAQEEQQ